MGDNVDSDLLYDDINQNIDNNDSYNDQGDDLYDDVLTSNNVSNNENNSSQEMNSESETNGSYQGGNMHHIARRFQLYVGNLTWWTTDQDITDAVIGVGVQDFQEVKFFENRANGQSKGFCVITLGSESSMRLVMENLSKKELNGQNPVVTLPTKQALNQFESQQKTRPTPPIPPNNQKMPPGGNMGMPPQHPPRMMNPNPMMRGPNPMGMNSNHGPPPMGMHRVPGPNGQNMPQRFQNNWNGPPRGPGGHNGMPPMNNRPPMNPMNSMNMNQRPMGMHPGQMGGPRPRPDWNNRPPMHGNHGSMPPRPPMPNQPHQPMPHVNPAFFNQQGPAPLQQGMPPNFNQQGGPPRNSWPGMNPVPTPVAQPPISDTEFEEIMGRNRTVSSSAIARAVSDAAAGEYASAIETLATAISLIKQSKVANDERCKILITSLQDTLQGIEAKSYNRRERSDRSRSRERRSRRRDRSSSRGYSSRRSRSREHREHRERGRDDRYYASENYHSNRERSRSRDRGTSDYRGEENRRQRKSPEASNEATSENFKRSYRNDDDRNRESERYQNRGDARSRH